MPMNTERPAVSAPFVDSCRVQTDQAYYVWSPAGDGGLERYFPGKLYADKVGLSIYSFAYRDKALYGRVRPFTENFGEKYDRVRKFDKHVMIAEFGVDGDTVRQRRWIAGALLSLPRFPLLETIVFFNSKDNPGAWEPQYGIPDWRIDPQVVQTIR